MSHSPSPLLAGRRVLLVEDEYFLAADLAAALRAAGADVVGPCASLAAAEGALAAAVPDMAVLDMNLRGASSGPLAERLLAAGVPFLVLSGYDRGALPDAACGAPYLEKPVDSAVVVAELGALAGA